MYFECRDWECRDWGSGFKVQGLEFRDERD